ncbi:hypothetical protein CJU89_3382 [Yarrowia sp. B02]|nr:hypothetical protein CJU89_3382 [Yarrowia sp. B02]
MAVKSIFKRQQPRRSKLNISAPTPVQVHKPTSFATKEIRFVNPELQQGTGEGLQRQRTLQRRAERQGTIKEKKTRSVRDYLRLPFIRLRQLIRATLRRRATIKRRKTLKKSDIVHTTADAVRRTPSQASLRRTASTASLRRQPSTRGLRRKASQSRGGIRKSKSTSRKQSRYKTIEDLDQVTDFDEYDSGNLEFQFSTKDMVRMHPRGEAKIVHPVPHKKITFNAVPEIIQKHAPLTPPDSPKRVASLDREIVMGAGDDEHSPLLVTSPHSPLDHAPESPPAEFNINSEDIYARKYPSGVGVADADSIEVTSTIGTATIEQIDQLFQGFDYDYRDKIEKKLELITRRLQQFDADMINRGTQTRPWRHSVDSAMSEQIEAVLFDVSRDSGHTFSTGRDSIREYMREHMEAYDHDALLEEEQRRKSSTYYSMGHESDTDSYASFAPSSSGSSSYESFAPSHPVPIYESSGSSRRIAPEDEETTPLLEQGDFAEQRAPFLSKHRKSPSDSTIASTVSSIHSRRAIPTTHNPSEQSFDFGFDRESPQPGPSGTQRLPGRRVTSVAQSRESLYLDLAPSPELHPSKAYSDLRHEIRPESGDSYHTAASIPQRSPLRPTSSGLQELKPMKVRASPRQLAQQSPKRFSASSIGAIGAIGGESSWMKTPRPLPPVPVLSPKQGDSPKRAVSSLEVPAQAAPVQKRAFSAQDVAPVSPVGKKPEYIPSAPSHPPPSPPVFSSPVRTSPTSVRGSPGPAHIRPVSIDWVDAADAESEIEVDTRSSHSGSHSSSSGNPPSPPTASDQVLQRMYRELEELQQRSVQLSDMVARTEQGAPFSDTESNRGSVYLTRDALAVIPTPMTPSFPSSFMTAGPTHGTISSHAPGPGSLPTTSHTTPIARGGLNRRRVRSSVFLEPPTFVRGHSRGDSAVSNISTASAASGASSIGLSDIPVPSSMPAPRHLVPPAEPSDKNVMEWRQAIRPPFARGPSVTRGKRLSVAGTSTGTDTSDFQFSDDDIELQEAQVVGSRFPVLIDNSGTDRIKSVIVTRETEDEE